MGFFSKLKRVVKKALRILPAFVPFIPGLPQTGRVLAGVVGASPAFPTVGARMPGGTLSRAELMAVAPTQAGMIPRIGGAVRGTAVAGAALVVGVVRTLAGKARGVRLPNGRFINRRSVVSIAKRIGIDAAAVGLFITAAEVAELIVEDAAAPRRVRGITGADIRATRRTLGKIRSIERQLSGICPPRRAPARRSAGRGGITAVSAG